jgi:hypothetical protein
MGPTCKPKSGHSTSKNRNRAVSGPKSRDRAVRQQIIVIGQLRFSIQSNQGTDLKTGIGARGFLCFDSKHGARYGGLRLSAGRFLSPLSSSAV